MGIFSGKGDETILDYICGVLEDEHFDWGASGDGSDAFEAIGPFLVRGWDLVHGSQHAGYMGHSHAG